MKNFIILALIALGLASCEDSDLPGSMIEGTYKGKFYRTSPNFLVAPVNVTLSFNKSRFEGESEEDRRPAICEGSYTLRSNDIIEFENGCAWTADFDWTYILSGEFEYEINGEYLHIVKVHDNGTIDRYELTNIEQEDYIIFGHYYGFCIGEPCIETFKLTSSALYEDTRDDYGVTSGFEFKRLSKEKFELVNGLADEIPMELFQEESQTFGCPDCADQGGVLIQILRDGEIKTWKIDQNLNNLPEYLHSLVENVNQKIEQINKD